MPEHASEEQVFERLSDAVSDYIHGDGRDAIVAGLAESTESLDGTIGAMTYEIVHQTAEQIEGPEADVVDMDMLFGLATETIDYLIEVAHAMNLPTGDDDDLRADSLIKAVELHMATVQDDPEEVAAAQEMLAVLMEDGTFDEGSAYVNQRLQKEGVDPASVQAEGHRMAAGGGQDPLAAGVQQGLMGGMQ